jgi:hypothetical protein
VNFLTKLAANPSAETSGIIEWFNSWSDQAKLIVPAVGTFLAIIVGLVVMFAGRNWSEVAKKWAGAIIAGILIISYAPSLITGMVN